MKKLLVLSALLALILSACATAGHPISGAAAPTNVTTDSIGAPTTHSADGNSDQSKLLTLQDRLNVFASPKYIAQVEAAKAAGSDAIQNQCMDVTLAIGADLKAKPLIAIASVDLGPVDKSCGWCVLAAQRKLDAERRGGPSLLTQIADGRRRLASLARMGLVACAPLKEDIRLSLLNPEDAAANLIGLFDLLSGH
jgi:hypothetical protein